MSTPNTKSRPIIRESALVLVGVIALMFIELLLLRATSMLSRPLWLDECVTDIVVSAPTWEKAKTDLLAGGVDANPPFYYLLMRQLAQVGMHSPTSYRIVAMFCIAAGIAGIYANLRQVFCQCASLAGALAVWSIPLVAEHAFEGRFYGLLFASTAWTAYFASRADRWLAKLGLIVASSIACGTHWFGIIGVALIVAGEVVVRWRARRSIVALWPAWAGPITVGVFFPLLMAQKSAIGGETFVTGNAFRSMIAFYMLLLPGSAAAVVLIVSLIDRMFGGEHRSGGRDSLSPLFGLFMLALMPVCLVVVSIIQQPVMQLRYCIVACAAMAVPVAFAASQLRTDFWRGLAIAGIILVSFNSMFRVWLDKSAATAEFKQFNALAIDAQKQGSIVLCELRHDQYPLIWMTPELSKTVFFMDESLPEESRLHRFERTMAKRVEKIVGSPATRPLSQSDGRFYFVAGTNDGAAIKTYFPGAKVEALGGRAFAISR